MRSTDLTRHPGETLDVLGQDRLYMIQPQEGYRFSIDSLLLWGFLKPTSQDTWIDLGTGCGILAIALAKVSGVKRVIGLEIQSELIDIARRNVSLNHVASRVDLLKADVRDLRQLNPLPKVDGVCANPPYYPTSSGRINPDRQKAVARHEIAGGMLHFIKAGSYLLKRGGRYATIIPAQRLQEALHEMATHRLHLSRFRPVYSYKHQPATLVLLEALKERSPTLSIAPPLTIYQSPNVYTDEIQALMSLNPLKSF